MNNSAAILDLADFPDLRQARNFLKRAGLSATSENVQCLLVDGNIRVVIFNRALAFGEFDSNLLIARLTEREVAVTRARLQLAI